MGLLQLEIVGVIVGARQKCDCGARQKCDCGGDKIWRQNSIQMVRATKM